MDRVSRRLTDLKQNKIHVARYKPSVAILKEGEEVLYVRKDGILSRYRKEQGILWRSDMFKNEDIISKGTIRTKNLQYDTKFIDHRMFVHNFQDDISTSEVFLPWFSITEQTGMDQAQGTSFQKISNNVGNGNDECVSGTLHLFDPSSTTFVKHFIARSAEYHNEDYVVDSYTAGYVNTTTAITRVQFKFESGNIDSGVIKLYGVS